MIGRLYHWFVKLAFGLRLRDVDCDFRLMRRSVFDKVRLTRSSGVICVELMKKVQDHGYRIAEVPVHHFHRSYGKSQFFNFPRVARTLVDLARLWVELVVRRLPPRARHRARAAAARSRPVSDHRDSYRGRKVLVTGGLGFIGSNLCRTLADLGAQVPAVDSLLPDYGGNLFNLDGYEDKVRINIADVRGHGMEYLVRGQEVLFNLAGQVSHIDSMSDPVTDLEINCTSQLRLLEAVRRGNPELKIVYAGTRQVYGRPLYLPVDEKHLLQPVDVNGINKISGEFYHLVYHQVYGIRASSLRLTNTYGPRQLIRHNRQGFIGWFVRQAALGEEIQLFGDGQQKRDFNHVDDVVDAFLRAGASDAADGQVMNLGDPHPVSLRSWPAAARGRGRRLLPARAVSARAQAHRHRRLLRRHHAGPDDPRLGSRASPCARAWRRRSPSTAATRSTTCERQPVPFVDFKAHVAALRAELDEARRARARLRLVHPRARGRGFRARAGGGARRQARGRGGQRHRRDPPRAARARGRPRRRGGHHLDLGRLLGARHPARGRAAGVRGRRPADAQHRPRGGRARASRRAPRRSCPCTSTATRRTWTRCWSSRASAAWRSSRTPARRTAPATAAARWERSPASRGSARSPSTRPRTWARSATAARSW